MAIFWKDDGTFTYKCETPNCKICEVERQISEHDNKDLDATLNGDIAEQTKES